MVRNTCFPRSENIQLLQRILMSNVSSTCISKSDRACNNTCSPGDHPHLAFVEREITMQFSIATAGITSRTMPPTALPYLACIQAQHRSAEALADVAPHNVWVHASRDDRSQDRLVSAHIASGVEAECTMGQQGLQRPTHMGAP